MARKPKKWPSYALSSLEVALFNFTEIKRRSRLQRTAARNRDIIEVMDHSSEIQDLADAGILALVQARTGDYTETL